MELPLDTPRGAPTEGRPYNVALSALNSCGSVAWALADALLYRP